MAQYKKRVRCKDSHYKYKRVSRPLCLYNGNPRIWIYDFYIEKGSRSSHTIVMKPCNNHFRIIDLIHKSQNIFVPHPTILHSEQKCAYFVLNGALWDMEHVNLGFAKLVYWSYTQGTLEENCFCLKVMFNFVTTCGKICLLFSIRPFPFNHLKCKFVRNHIVNIECLKSWFDCIYAVHLPHT